MIDLRGIDFAALKGGKLEQADRALHTYRRAIRAIADPAELFIAQYDQSKSRFPLRRDEIDMNRPGRLPAECRNADRRMSAVKAGASHIWPPTLVSQSLKASHAELCKDISPELAGTIRMEELALGPAVESAMAEYHAPSAQRVAEELAALDEVFVEAADHHPLIAITIFYAAAILIHPFRDGNGRATRALVEATLHTSGLTGRHYLSIEGVFREQERANGFRLAKLDQDGDWAVFSDFFYGLLISSLAQNRKGASNHINSIVNRFG